MEPINEESLSKGYRLAVYICCAMIASVFVYTGVVEFLAAKNAPFHGFSPLPAAVYDKLRLILLGVALIDLAIHFPRFGRWQEWVQDMPEAIQ